jgi:uncharacterized membrane protein YdjX (TVP38/TMEM64 family)
MKLLGPFITILIITGLAVLLSVWDWHTPLNEVTLWIHQNQEIGLFLFFIGYTLISLLMIPTTVFNLVAGTLFRPLPVSVLMILAGGQLSLLLSYVLGNTILASWIKRKKEKNEKLQIVEQAIKKEHFKIIVMLRLTPILPYGLLNMLIASSSIPVVAGVLGTLVGDLPLVTVLCLVGSLFNAGEDQVSVPPKTQYAILLLSIVFGVLSCTYITVLIRSALRNAIKNSNGEFEVDLDSDGKEQHIPTSIKPSVGSVIGARESCSGQNVEESNRHAGLKRIPTLTIITKNIQDEIIVSIVSPTLSRKTRSTGKLNRTETLILHSVYVGSFIGIFGGLPLIWFCL